MTKLYFLLALIFINAAFGSIPESVGADARIGFWLHDQKLTPQSWFHASSRYVSFALICYMQWQEAVKYRLALKAFFFIQVFNTIQFWLHYTSFYFVADTAKVIGISFPADPPVLLTTHWLSMFIFGYYMYREDGMDRTGDLSLYS